MAKEEFSIFSESGRFLNEKFADLNLKLKYFLPKKTFIAVT